MFVFSKRVATPPITEQLSVEIRKLVIYAELARPLPLLALSSVPQQTATREALTSCIRTLQHRLFALVVDGLLSSDQRIDLQLWNIAMNYALFRRRCPSCSDFQEGKAEQKGEPNPAEDDDCHRAN